MARGWRHSISLDGANPVVWSVAGRFGKEARGQYKSAERSGAQQLAGPRGYPWLASALAEGEIVYVNEKAYGMGKNSATECNCSLTDDHVDVAQY